MWFVVFNNFILLCEFVLFELNGFLELASDDLVPFGASKSIKLTELTANTEVIYGFSLFYQTYSNECFVWFDRGCGYDFLESELP